MLSGDEEQTENDLEEQKKFEENLKRKVSQLVNKGGRPSISAEAYGDYNKKGNFVVKVIKKTDQQIALIAEKVMKSFLFNNLEEQELKSVIGAMGEKKIK